MIPNKLIEAVVALIFMIAALGQLPKFVQSVRIAQYQLLENSKSSTWSSLEILYLG